LLSVCAEEALKLIDLHSHYDSIAEAIEGYVHILKLPSAGFELMTPSLEPDYQSDRRCGICSTEGGVFIGTMFWFGEYGATFYVTVSLI
jgi:hypothetical protein